MPLPRSCGCGLSSVASGSRRCGLLWVAPQLCVEGEPSGFSGLQGGGAGISSEGEMDGEERGEIMGVPSRDRFGDSWCGESAACLLIRN